MQKFTRSLTREVEIGGERLAVTFSAEGLELRPVGSRRPPLTVSWGGLLCAAVDQSSPEAQPQASAVAEALHRLKNPPKVKKEAMAEAPASTAAPSSGEGMAPPPAAPSHEEGSKEVMA